MISWIELDIELELGVVVSYCGLDISPKDRSLTGVSIWGKDLIYKLLLNHHLSVREICRVACQQVSYPPPPMPHPPCSCRLVNNIKLWMAWGIPVKLNETYTSILHCISSFEVYFMNSDDAATASSFISYWFTSAFRQGDTIFKKLFRISFKHYLEKDFYHQFSSF